MMRISPNHLNHFALTPATHTCNLQPSAYKISRGKSNAFSRVPDSASSLLYFSYHPLTKDSTDSDMEIC